MSEPSFTVHPALMTTPEVIEGARKYSLASDLARLSLPAAYKDSYRKLAWVDSICFFFLVVGLIGLNAPKVIHKPLSEPMEVVPVVFTPPEEQPKAEPEVKQEEAEPQDTPVETPQVAAVVAAADASTVAFAVPVEGAVAVASPRFVPAPPPVIQAPPPKPAPTPTKFNPDAADGGTHPKPDYPGLAQRNRYQGTVTLEIRVDESGKVTATKVQKSSGYPILDEAAVKVVTTRWSFLPGSMRILLWDCKFELR
jgi:TonB family protein